MNRVIFADNLEATRGLEDGLAQLVYIDPPFNTGNRQERERIRTHHDEENGDRTGFQGKRYRTVKLGSSGYADAFDNYQDFLEPRLREARRLLDASGSFFLHVDYREVHYCKVLMDRIFGRDCFLNEIIWAYDYGGRPKNRWPAKHDNILLYVKDPKRYTFNYDDLDRIPYMAPGLVGPEKAARGKTPTDTWWQTIVPTNSKERVGYPTQKPLAILKRIVTASSNPGDLVLDFFAGSGTTGVAAAELGRRSIMTDNNPQAIDAMRRRFEGVGGVEFLVGAGDFGSGELG